MDRLERALFYTAAALCVILPFAYLAYVVTHYRAHTDDVLWVQSAALFFGVIALFMGIGSVRCQMKARAAASALALVLCLAIMFIAQKIPFCPECDHTTREDVGILSYWLDIDRYWGE